MARTYFESLSREDQDEIMAVARRYQSRPAAQPSQRQTFAESSSYGAPFDEQEDSPFSTPDLQPGNWRALADRRVPWPHQSLDPHQAISELASFMTYGLLQRQANAMGRTVQMLGINPNDEI